MSIHAADALPRPSAAQPRRVRAPRGARGYRATRGHCGESATRASIDPETYFDELPESTSDVVRGFLEDVPLLGAELQWRHYGPRVRVRGFAGPKVVASVQGDSAYLVTGPLQGIDPQPALRTLERLHGVSGVSVKPGATYPSINIRKVSPEDLQAFFGIARDFVRELVDSHAT